MAPLSLSLFLSLFIFFFSFFLSIYPYLADLLYSCCFFLNLLLQLKVLSENGKMVQFKLWGVYFNGVEEKLLHNRENSQATRNEAKNVRFN